MASLQPLGPAPGTVRSRGSTPNLLVTPKKAETEEQDDQTVDNGEWIVCETLALFLFQTLGPCDDCQGSSEEKTDWPPASTVGRKLENGDKMEKNRMISRRHEKWTQSRLDHHNSRMAFPSLYCTGTMLTISLPHGFSGTTSR
jgi:hypothetical protein